MDAFGQFALFECLRRAGVAGRILFRFFVLDLEGAAGPDDVAIVGDESAVGEELDRLAEAGATDFLGIPFRVDGDEDAVARTRALLVRRAARS